MALVTFTKSTSDVLGNKDTLSITLTESSILEDTEIVTEVRTAEGVALTDKINVNDRWDGTNRILDLTNATEENVVGEIQILADGFDATEVEFEFSAAEQKTPDASTGTEQVPDTESTEGSSTDTSTSSPDSSTTSPDTSVSGGDTTTSTPSVDTGTSDKEEEVSPVVPPTTTTPTPDTSKDPEPSKPVEQPEGQTQDGTVQQPDVEEEIVLQDLEISIEKNKFVEETDDGLVVTTYLLGSGGAFVVAVNSSGVMNYEVESSDPNIEVIKYKSIRKFSVSPLAYTEGEVTIRVDGYKPKTFKVVVKRQFTIPIFNEDGTILTDSPDLSQLFETRVVNLEEAELPYTFPFANAIDQITQAPIIPTVESNNPIITGTVIDGTISVAVSQRLAEDVNGLLTVKLGDNHLPLNVNVTVYRAEWMESDFVPKEFPFHNAHLSFFVGDKSYIYLPDGITEDNLGISVEAKNPDLEVEGEVLVFDFKPELQRLYISSDVVGEYVVTFTHEKWLETILNVQVVEDEDSDGEEEIETSGEVYYDLGECPKVRLEYNADNLVSVAIEASEIKGEKAKLAYILEQSKGKPGAYEKIYTLANGLCTYNQEMSKKDIESEDGANQNAILYSLFMSVINEEDDYTFKELFRLIVRIFKIYQSEALNELKITRFEEAWTLPKAQFDLIGLLGSFFNKYVNTNGAVSVTTLNISDSAKNKIKGYMSKNILP